MIEMYIIQKGKKPEYRRAVRWQTFDTWIREGK